MSVKDFDTVVLKKYFYIFANSKFTITFAPIFRCVKHRNSSVAQLVRAPDC